MKHVVFVLSAGRAGTKYVADVISKAYPDHVEVWHERLKLEAGAGKYFRQYDTLATEQQGTDVLPIRNMINSIKKTIKEKPYIDTGWTLHSLFPLFLDEFGDAVRFVFQVRHPFDAAASHAIKGAYRVDWDGLADWKEHCFLHPSDNAFYPDVKWDKMSPFEKALWRWGELALYWRN